MVLTVAKDQNKGLDVLCLVAMARTLAHTALEDLCRLSVNCVKVVVGRQLGGIVIVVRVIMVCACKWYTIVIKHCSWFSIAIK
jgi:hypothetical protein